MFSMPTFLYENVHFELFFDNVFFLKSNLLTGLLPNYRATIEIEKISAYKNIRQINLESFIFGIKFMKDKLVVENIDIPLDESENTINCTAF
ncbi:hypothetical protein NBO_591g0005 [Nosema bombycis CQ1]|uniref:Uncharacterized protein n=1 Tax=Nosema bombycis (strain CQ1 / CVCC 102059) TaxID=578461 RepID=R0MGV7_NOSB1|nr:hypothetical protein NBO_591g0005 [Nosema bombycis CQ1]|eukprot:EOB12013.1 hypothetical protein NBO_591g0005 [Nosema bombycis CQ1]